MSVPWWGWLLLGLFGAAVVGGGAYLIYRYGIPKKNVVATSAAPVTLRLHCIPQTMPRTVAGASLAHSDLQIDHLKYIFKQISFHKDATPGATNVFDVNPEGAVQLPLATQAEMLWDEAKDSGTTAPWTDVMDATAVNKLFQQVSFVGLTGTFQFVTLEALRCVKVKATATLPDGRTVVTHEGARSTTRDAPPGPMSNYTTVSDVLFTAGTADEATLIEASNTSPLRLFEPVTLGQGQVVVLVYDPYLLIRAVTDDAELGLTPGNSTLQDVAGSYWAVPPVSFTPVVLKVGDVLQRELYQLNLGEWQGVVVLYVVGQSVKGATCATVAQDGQPLPASVVLSVPNVSYLDQGADGSWTLSDLAHQPLVSGLTRGLTGECHVHCRPGNWGFCDSRAALDTACTFTRSAVEDVLTA